jgi:hypothetical protein
MKGVRNSPAFCIAFCAVIAALEVVLMMITGMIPVGTYALPCFAGILTLAIVIEFGWKWALGVFAAASLLSALFAADKEAVLYFIALFGYYPIVKNAIERKIKSKVLQYLIKFAVFNAAAVASFYIAVTLLSVKAEEFTIFGVYIPPVFLAIGNLFFLVYDFAVTVFVTFYVRNLREKLFGKMK